MVALLYPLLGGPYPVTQNFSQHKARALGNGWCIVPSPCPGGVWYYPGIDYGVPVGVATVATEGRTDRLEDQGTRGYGKHARIRHADNTLTVYAHLSWWDPNLAIGDWVKTGEVIARSGNTGLSSGPHLHFEHRDAKGIPVDPSHYIMALLTPTPSPIPAPLPNPPAAVFAPGDAVVLKSDFTYVNVRREPRISTSTYLYRFLPEDKAVIAEQQGEWVRVSVNVWIHAGYLQKV